MKTLTFAKTGPIGTFGAKSSEPLSLVKPTPALAVEFLAYAYECFRHGQEQFIEPITNIRRYFDTQRRYEQGRDLPEGHLPASEFWLIRDNWFVAGSSTLRHELNDFYLHQGGHIDLIVRPSLRQQGYADRLLEETLRQAKGLGLSRVLLTCDSGNPVGEVYENHGARLENKVIAYDTETLVSRYWVAL